jgi:hypothetical protein
MDKLTILQHKRTVLLKKFIRFGHWLPGSKNNVILSRSCKLFCCVIYNSGTVLTTNFILYLPNKLSVTMTLGYKGFSGTNILKMKCCKYSRRNMLTTNSLTYVQINPISLSVTMTLGYKGLRGTNILKMKCCKYSRKNMLTTNSLTSLQMNPISLSVTIRLG